MSVPPSTSLNRYCKFETTGYDMNSGPQISSKVGRLIACTCPQKCPLPSPKSRYNLPPGQASIFIFIDCPSGVSLNGPSCSINVANVTSIGACTQSSSVMLSVIFSIADSVEIIVPPEFETTSNLLHLLFCSLFQLVQLMPPQPLKGARPLV